MVTTAPTTAALATGDRPGETAEPTTAAFATGEAGRDGSADDGRLRDRPTDDAGCPMREGRSGMSGSFSYKGFVGLYGGDDGLDRDRPFAMSWPPA